MHLDIQNISALLVGCFTLIAGAIILVQDPDNKVNITFALFAATGAFWAFGVGFFLYIDSSAWLDFLGRFLYFAGTCIPVAFLYFSRTFTTGRLPSLRATLLILLPSLITLPLYFFTDKIVAGYLLLPDGIRGFTYGPWQLLFQFQLWGFFGITLYKLSRKYLTTQEAILKQQLLYIIIGTYSTLAVAGITDVITPTFFSIFGLIWIGPTAMIVWICAIAYAVTRHQLFDVRVVATEFLTISLWLALLFRTALSNGTQDLLINGILFIVVLVLGLFLIRSAVREVEQRELIVRQEKDLETVNKQQENLLHFMSHEIKGYLTKSEAGFSAIAEGDFGQTSQELHDMADMALTEVRKGVRTVMDILDASNLKRGTVSYKKSVFDMRDIVTNVLDHLKPAAEDKHLSIEAAIAWEVPCKIDGDEEKVRDHVIRNLIDNAVKYTPAGTIKVEVARKGPVVRFAVEDSGVGITPEDMQRLFTEGGHGKDSIKVNVHSTGYGLYIAKTIVDAHGGKIWAESAGTGKGSRFVVELPAA